jgi:GT2 family glycosyltransferase
LITGDDILPTRTMMHEHWIWHTERYPKANVGVLGRVQWAEELGATPFMRWLEQNGTQFAYATLHHGDKVDYGHLYTSNVSIKKAFLVASGEFFNEELQLALCEDSEWGLRLFHKGFELRYNADAIGNHFHPTTLASSLTRIETLGKSGALLRSVSTENFDRITNNLFTPRNRTKLLLLRALFHPTLGQFIYAPLATLCERRIFADRLFAACHASYFLKGLLEAGVIGR